MPKITFTRDADYSIDMKPVVYKAGQTYDLPQDQCDRWIKREAAAPYVAPLAKAKEAVGETLTGTTAHPAAKNHNP